MMVMGLASERRLARAAIAGGRGALTVDVAGACALRVPAAAMDVAESKKRRREGMEHCKLTGWRRGGLNGETAVGMLCKVPPSNSHRLVGLSSGAKCVGLTPNGLLSPGARGP